MYALVPTPSPYLEQISQQTHKPVNIDWSTLKVVDLIVVIRISAGTLSPTAKTNKTGVIAVEFKLFSSFFLHFNIYI